MGESPHTCGKKRVDVLGCLLVWVFFWALCWFAVRMDKHARGRGNPESFDSCSHGAGRAMSRTQALKNFTVEDHVKATVGVVCDKTQGVLDETPKAYKDIDDVMMSQTDLVSADKALTQMVCVKGLSD